MNVWSFVVEKVFGLKPESEKRMTLDDVAAAFKYGGNNYLVNSMARRGSNAENIGNDFEAYVTQAYQANGIVFACQVARMLIFSEARFQFQRMRNGRPGDLFGTPALSLLEKPWPTGTTGDLMNRAIQDADFAGNHYVVDEGTGRVRRLRPDWVEIILTAPPDEASAVDIVGHIYKPGGNPNPDQWKIYPITGEFGRVAHWAPIPDPLSEFRGMSWLTPVLREIDADSAATRHKGKFFENAATPNLTVSFKESVTPDQFEEFMRIMDAQKHGVEHAYETLYLGGGADVNVVGADMAQIDFKTTQGAGETRIAAAARVHPVIVGLSEGMQGSSLNAGNYQAAKRSFADGTMRPLWRSLCGAYETLVPPPPDSRLWVDTRDVAFLREDEKDLAEIQKIQSSTITQYVRDGFTAESSKAAVLADDVSLLVHTGLYSVQLQKPGVDGDPSTKETKPAKEEEDE